MKMLAIFGIVAALGLSIGTAGALERREFRPNVQQRVIPLQRMENRPVRMFGGFQAGPRTQFRREERTMIQGHYGVHIVRNQSRVVRIFSRTVGVAAAEPVETEQYIETINPGAPLIPVLNPCDGPCSVFGAVSVGNDRASGTAWNFSDPGSAQELAQRNCMERSTNGACSPPIVIQGSQWAAVLFCSSEAGGQGYVSAGNDDASALTNAYRFVQQNGAFDAMNECELIGLIAADGSHQQ